MKMAGSAINRTIKQTKAAISILLPQCLTTDRGFQKTGFLTYDTRASGPKFNRGAGRPTGVFITLKVRSPVCRGPMRSSSLSVRLLALGELSTVGFVIALCISATAVDATPFSTVGALTVANAPTPNSNRSSRHAALGLYMILVAPAAAWLIFVLIPSL
jgi:hypothetical protein